MDGLISIARLNSCTKLPLPTRRTPTSSASVRPHVRSSIRPSVHQFVLLFVRSFVRPAVHLPTVLLNVCSSIRPSVRPPVRSSLHQSVRPFVRQSVRQLVSLSLRPFVRPFVRLIVRFSIRQHIRSYGRPPHCPPSISSCVPPTVCALLPLQPCRSWWLTTAHRYGAQASNGGRRRNAMHSSSRVQRSVDLSGSTVATGICRYRGTPSHRSHRVHFHALYLA